MKNLGIVSDDKDLATLEATRKTIRVTVPSSGWVTSTKSGYYENVVTVANSGGHPIWGITGATDDDLPTADEEEAFNATKYMWADGTSFIFYAEEAPTATFYVIVRE